MNKLVHSHYRGLSCGDPCRHLGAHRWGSCAYCPYINVVATKVLTNGRLHKPIHYVNCKRIGVVYLMTCSFALSFMSVRPKKHSGYVFLSTSNLSGRIIFMHPYRNISNYHNKEFSSICFYPLKHLHSFIRGGEIDTALLRMETRWIFNLKATSPPWLNEYISYASFLNKY